MKLNSLVMQASLECYPDDLLAAAIERDIEAALPPLDALVPGMTQGQRLMVYQDEVVKARATFCARFGDPFGCEDHSLEAETTEARTSRQFVKETETL